MADNGIDRVVLCKRRTDVGKTPKIVSETSSVGEYERRTTHCSLEDHRPSAVVIVSISVSTSSGVVFGIVSLSGGEKSSVQHLLCLWADTGECSHAIRCEREELFARLGVCLLSSTSFHTLLISDHPGPENRIHSFVHRYSDVVFSRPPHDCSVERFQFHWLAVGHVVVER